MAITIETPTAEVAFAALQLLPEPELARLREMLAALPIDDKSYWTDEDLEDAQRATALLIEKRFGPEEGDYD